MSKVRNECFHWQTWTAITLAKKSNQFSSPFIIRFGRGSMDIRNCSLIMSSLTLLLNNNVFADFAAGSPKLRVPNKDCH